jgi:hypothetical protein
MGSAFFSPCTTYLSGCITPPCKTPNTRPVAIENTGPPLLPFVVVKSSWKPLTCSRAMPGAGMTELMTPLVKELVTVPI